ncbi:hypothetical protein AB0D67_27805 [Streptosporangium sp. NPDC048047]|uniref:hypothetical protein n=1 Tax=Streptosporangium sp. NPDC048047 TaxID=3155748 RepID=UPI00342032D0
MTIGTVPVWPIEILTPVTPIVSGWTCYTSCSPSYTPCPPSWTLVGAWSAWSAWSPWNSWSPWTC